MIIYTIFNTMTHRMLMIQDALGNRTNFSAIKNNECELYINTQNKISERIDALFENVSAAESFVLSETPVHLKNNICAQLLSTLSTGLSHLANHQGDFLHVGSDFVDLNIIKSGYQKFSDNAILTNEASNLLTKYNLQIEQLDSFDTDELFNNLKNTQLNASVNYLTEKTNTFILHSIPHFRPEANSPLSGEITSQQKIEILRSSNPEICASSFQNGTKHLSNDFGHTKIGVILSDGIVKHASNTDFGSTVDSHGMRSNRHSFENRQDVIEDVIKSRTNDTSYNEIIVANPDIAGVYLNLDSLSKDGRTSFGLNTDFEPLSLVEVFKNLHHMSKNSEKDLPILTIHNGEIRETRLSKSFLSDYLPKNQKFQARYDVEEYGTSAERHDYDNKKEKWKTLSSDEILQKAFIRSEPLSYSDLRQMGIDNRLSDTHKLELLEKNAPIMKGGLAQHKIGELKNIIGDKNISSVDLNMDLSVFDGGVTKKPKQNENEPMHKMKSSI